MSKVTCYYCAKKFITIKVFLYYFKIEHNLEKDFKCGENNCFRTFSNYRAFKRHLVTHFPNDGIPTELAENRSDDPDTLEI